MTIRPPRAASKPSLSERIKTARSAAGLRHVDIATHFNISPKAVSQWERDAASDAKRKPARPDIEKLPALAKLLRVTLDWLLGSESPAPARSSVPVVGYVGAGSEIHPFDDHAKGEGIDEVPAFPGQAGPAVAVRVRGDSMLPMLEDGWTLYYAADQSAGVADDAIGRLSVCQIADGPLLVKKLERGRRKGVWRLVSTNASPREDVKLEWAARVRAIVP
jgi:transcriptional regulator with XRE-family HTH domain